MKSASVSPRRRARKLNPFFINYYEVTLMQTQRHFVQGLTRKCSRVATTHGQEFSLCDNAGLEQSYNSHTNFIKISISTLYRSSTSTAHSLFITVIAS
jgi:hypothetical protein